MRIDLKKALMFSSLALFAACTDDPKPEEVVTTQGQEDLMKHDQASEFDASSNKIYFAFDKHNVPSQYVGAIDNATQYLKNNPSKQLTVQGHCDSRGSAEYNLVLGNERANAVREYMVRAQADVASRVDAISFGKEMPEVKDAKTNQEHALNRRAVFVAR